GYSVEGVYMRNWDTTDESGVCTSDQDWRDVQAVCKQLDIPCRHVDFTKEYWVKVFTKMIEDYENGFTPNPDIICNREIKFGLFLDKCLGSMFNAKWFATGHYVQVDHIHDRVKLLRGVDSTKDQSYFLSAVPEEKLKWAIFPVGKLYKTQVKSIASNANLITANKQESMGVCFIGKKKKFAEFLKQYLVTKPGDIKTIDGRIIAQIRYRQSPVSCTVISRSNGRYFVEFETPQRAIAPGQVVVIWDNNWCLGSGVIEYAL
ncbi:30212_t:CDS:2, partial [Gigaspora margarita]